MSDERVHAMLILKDEENLHEGITPKTLYLNRRQLLAGLPAAFLGVRELLSPSGAQAAAGLGPLAKSPLSTSEKASAFKDVTTYNNFYEFGTSKEQPAQLAKNFKTSPWVVSVEGEAGKPRKFTMEEILKVAPLEERIYRHRCVEGWSIVVPWVGYSLSALLKQVEPTSKAKFVAFESYYDAKANARGQKRRYPASVCGRPPNGRSYAPARSSLCGHVRRGPSTSGRCASPVGGAVEIRFQEHQIAGQDQARSYAAKEHLELQTHYSTSPKVTVSAMSG
jgi:Oxidoreductase molybdopterin binding domain